MVKAGVLRLHSRSKLSTIRSETGLNYRSESLKGYRYPDKFFSVVRVLRFGEAISLP